MRPAVSTGLEWRCSLAVASVAGYWIAVQLAGWIEGSASVPEPYRWAHYAAALPYGALVLGPYARRPWRGLRILSLCAASALVYDGAVRFVIGSPEGMTALAAFVVSGAAAALLCGIAVAVIAPRAFGLRLAALLIVAGAAGGAAFAVRVTFDPDLVIGHAVWQLLTCLALFLGGRHAPA